MSDPESNRGCLKGCAFGCLGIVVLGLATSGIIGLLTLRSSRLAVDTVSNSVRQELPIQAEHRSILEGASVTTDSQLGDATGEMALDLDESLPNATPSLPLPTGGVGTLDLDLSMGEFDIVPSDSTQIEVEADYDQARFRLEERFDEGVDGEWTYSITFKAKRRFLGAVNVRNRIKIKVPRDQPMRIEGDVKMGESNLELGGLWLTAVDLEMGMGDHEVSFAEATRSPIESFHVEGSMGELKVLGLGNASPASVDVSQRMGEMRLDLEGRWLNDSTVSAHCQMGECSVTPAEGVRYEGRGATVMLGDKSGSLPDDSEVPDDAPTIRLKVGTTMGSVRIR